MALEFCVRENLKFWKAPEVFVWPAIASGLMLLLPVADLQITALNVLIVTRERIFSTGLAIASFYLEKWNMPLFLRCLVYAILMFQQFASLATAALGLFWTCGSTSAGRQKSRLEENGKQPEAA